MKKTVLRIVKAVLFCSILVTIIAGASVLLERKESRGLHYTVDYPHPDTCAEQEKFEAKA